MALLKNNLEKSIQDLIHTVSVKEDAVIILSLAQDVRKDMIKQILEIFIANFENGTLCLVGDCGFNTVKSNLDELSDFTEGERRSIFTSQEIKVLALLDDMKMSGHPSLEIACVGKHASFLTRHKALDFPYGGESLFKDLYDLDATLFAIGNHNKLYPLKYAQSINPVITRNLCLYQNQALSYLDFEFDFEKANQLTANILEYQDAEVPMYAGSYRMIVDELQRKL